MDSSSKPPKSRRCSSFSIMSSNHGLSTLSHFSNVKERSGGTSSFARTISPSPTIDNVKCRMFPMRMKGMLMFPGVVPVLNRVAVSTHFACSLSVVTAGKIASSVKKGLMCEFNKDPWPL